MNLRLRVRRLEGQALRRRLSAHANEILEEDWLQVYESWANQDVFAEEADFPVALAGYRLALAEARHGQPPLDPPPDFQPQQPARQRITWWRRQHFYPALNNAWLWLAEFLERLHQGIPPITQAEFRELADWFGTNEERLTRLAATSEVLEVSAGRKTSLRNLSCGLMRGCQVLGVGRLAEDLRFLRARYG
jgi:hypothetical protein